jgi:hypothetical protein
VDLDLILRPQPGVLDAVGHELRDHQLDRARERAAKTHRVDRAASEHDPVEVGGHEVPGVVLGNHDSLNAHFGWI